MNTTKSNYYTTNLILLIFSICIFNSCSKNDITIEETISETIDKNTTVSDAQNNRMIVATYKYLKVDYSSPSYKQLMRNSFHASTTTSHSIENLDTNTDIWIFDEIDQATVDGLFTGIDTCIVCPVTHVEYLTVFEIEFEAFVTDAAKTLIRGDFELDLGNLDTELIQHQNTFINTELWIFRGCCKNDPIRDRIAALFDVKIKRAKLITE
ncbi:hypothetical protein [Olleya namhaensis]|uniref:Uncharacterized protein n=1 Tax=Olleya namhaensis TaxID=1144750 RepID=A0A1I3KP49_9FLAO|nr:hypothetical protein [Olleya namhaensis]SFI74301.1 hypothetical protein SAMN05443431_10263 [Olleya namhaensis]